MIVDLDELKEALLGDYEEAFKNVTFGHAIGAGNTLMATFDSTALTMIGPQLLDEFRMFIERADKDGVPGHIVETGVWAGGACIWAAAVLENLDAKRYISGGGGRPSRLVYVCDSFQGLPPSTHPKETLEFSEKSLAVPLERVAANFEMFGLLHRAVFVKGWFKDTMPTLNIPVAVLRMDGDLYESTEDVLKYMYDRVSPGGYVIVDDYQLPSCKRAVDEFRSRRRIRGSLQQRAGTWWQKPLSFKE